MEVTVAVAGGDDHVVDADADATVADLVDPLPLSIHEVSVLVDGRPVPADAPVGPDVDHVRVVRLVQGG